MIYHKNMPLNERNGGHHHSGPEIRDHKPPFVVCSIRQAHKQAHKQCSRAGSYSVADVVLTYHYAGAEVYI
jgi:hypothetical protein